MPKKFLLIHQNCRQLAFSTKEEVVNYIRRFARSNFKGTFGGDYAFPYLLDITDPKPKYICTFYICKSPFEVGLYRYSIAHPTLEALSMFFISALADLSRTSSDWDCEFPF